jgi:ABC-type phosphate/phosphonate transport system substrate-binding protein
MKKLLVLILLFTTACNLPALAAPTPTPTLGLPTPTPMPTLQVQPTSEPGTEANPLLLALTPSPTRSQTAVDAANALAQALEDATGYQIVTVAPAYEADLVRDFSIGNAHIGLLTPYGYFLAAENGDVHALLAKLRGGQVLYGVQFLARNDSNFKRYYDPVRDENTAEAEEALAQFTNRKPCWSDAFSPSGYVIPLGVLNQAGVRSGEPAFLEGQGTVVRGIYSKGICDFGATYTDARDLTILLQDYPDVMEKVVVIWRTPPLIPYEQIVVASRLNPEIKRSLLRAFIDLMGTDDGQALIQTVYGIDEFQPADESQYQDFGKLLKASGLDIQSLLSPP